MLLIILDVCDGGGGGSDSESGSRRLCSLGIFLSWVGLVIWMSSYVVGCGDACSFEFNSSSASLGNSTNTSIFIASSGPQPAVFAVAVDIAAAGEAEAGADVDVAALALGCNQAMLRVARGFLIVMWILICIMIATVYSSMKECDANCKAIDSVCCSCPCGEDCCMFVCCKDPNQNESTQSQLARRLAGATSFINASFDAYNQWYGICNATPLNSRGPERTLLVMSQPPPTHTHTQCVSVCVCVCVCERV